MKTKPLYSCIVFVQLLLLLGISGSLDAQSRKERDSLGITEKKFIEVDYMDSNGKERLERIERYNKDGIMIEEIDYDSNEKVKNHIQYVYENDLLIKEIYFDTKGKIEKYFVYEYDADGLKISKKNFDAKDKIYKEKIYRYQK